MRLVRVDTSEVIEAQSEEEDTSPAQLDAPTQPFRNRRTALGWWAVGLVAPLLGGALAVWLMLLAIGDSTEGSGLMVIFAAPAGYLFAAVTSVFGAWRAERQDPTPKSFQSRYALVTLGAITPLVLAFVLSLLAAALGIGVETPA